MSTITTINASDNITDSRAVINTNFSNLNTDKIETSVLDTDTALAANSDSKIATQKAVKTYIDTSGGANASTTVRGIVEEATNAEIIAGTAAGGTGARLFINPSTAAFPSPTVRTYLAAASPATWNKPSGLKFIVVEVQAAGGGGGGVNATTDSASGGGGAGGYSRKVILAAALGSTETVTIGAFGAGGVGNSNGSAGGNVSFGAHVTATGGSGGVKGSSSQGGGGAGAAGAGGDVNITGEAGTKSFALSAGIYISGKGGDSVLGTGGDSTFAVGGTNADAIAGSGYGSGGSGTAQDTNSSSITGGDGAPGIVIVTEYTLV